MSTITLPFSPAHEITSADNLKETDLYKKLPDEFRKAVDEYPHLLEYLHIFPIEEKGMPEYYPELTRKLGDIKHPNLIYPTAKKGIFVHVLDNPQDYRNSYIPIEPTLVTNVDDLVAEVENRLLELRSHLPVVDENTTREDEMIQYLEKVTTIDDEKPETSLLNILKTYFFNDGSNVKKLKVTKRQLEAIKYLFLREKVGLGDIDVLITDPHIEDISCSGTGQVFVEHKVFKGIKSAVTFTSSIELDKFVMWLSEQIRKPVTYKNPICDATLPDGSRINIVYGRDISKRGSNFTIRKFAGTPTSIFELVDFKSITYQMLAYLSLVIGHGNSLFVSGETASGKTTLLNALTTFIHPLAKIVTIEDTPELQVPHPNWVREVVQTTKAEDANGAVTMFDLLKAALRQRPDEIIVGEIRGVEGNVAFQAMQTGHSVMATFHAASVEKLIQRITGDPILVPKSYIDNLKVVVLTSMVKLPTGKTGRRITSINEIVGYDPVYDSFTFVEAFHWDESTDTFAFTGYMTSYILENVIAPKMGIPSRKKQRIYAEIERRTKILEKLHLEEKITNFYEVLEVLAKAQKEGYF
ncbi:MAG: type II/IV secretion system ATPase subunit [Dehalococcoidales bacterium]|nr:type II/IV secretion system ATPase subunit [Dehalococcoidales bacterium]